MVQVFNMTPTPSSGSRLGEALGIGISKNFPDPQQMVQRDLLKKALQEAKQSVRDPNATPLDKIFSFMEAGAGIPGSERYLGSLLPLIQKLTEAEASQKAPYGIQGQEGVGGVTGAQQPTRTEQFLDQFLDAPQQNQFYPSNVGAQEATGNLPQAATTGVKLPVLSNQQLMNLAGPYAAKMTKAGLPMTIPQAHEQLKAINEDNKASNLLVEQERKERVQSQREYGNIGAAKLEEVMPGASSEEVAYIKRQMEQFAGQNRSEADIERLAAGEARKYKNMVSGIEKTIPAARIYNKPFRKILGKSKSDISARNDLRVKVQPLLDAGLYDKARSLLADRGYYPEEREMIISNLGENATKITNQMPEITPEKRPHKNLTPLGRMPETGEEFVYRPEDVEKFKENLRNVLVSDPATNLILLRKQYEDKNIDWRLFKESLNDFITDKTFKPDDDQFKQLNKLEEPPLDNLEKLLFGLGIIGR